MQHLRAQRACGRPSRPLLPESSGKEEETSLELVLPQHRATQYLLSQSSGYIIFRAPGFKKSRISRLSQRRIKPNRALLRRSLVTAEVTHQSCQLYLSIAHLLMPGAAESTVGHRGLCPPARARAAEGPLTSAQVGWRGILCSAATSRKICRPRGGLYKGPEGREAVHV